MKKRILLLTYVMSVVGAGMLFAQEEEKRNHPKGVVYNNTVVDVAKEYKTLEIVEDMFSKKWNISADNNILKSGAYTNNSTYRSESMTIKLPKVNNVDERLNLHVTEQYELESNHDEGKILVSQDNGTNWETISIRSGRSENRVSVLNLTKYAGQKIKIAFELKTDESINYKGWTVEHAEIKHEVVNWANAAGTFGSSTRSSLKSVSTQAASSLTGNFTNLDAKKFPSEIFLSCEVFENNQPLGTLTEDSFTVYEKIDSLWLTDTTWTVGKEYIEHRNIKNAPREFKVKLPQNSSVEKYADIVFFMDNSGSLGNEQAAVKANVERFLDSLKSKGISARIGLVRFGQYLDSGAPVVEKNGLSSWWNNYPNVSKNTVEDFKQMWSKTNIVNGSREPSYDALMKGLEASSYSFTQGAKKIFILITDEPMSNGENDKDNISTYRDRSVGLNAMNKNNVTVYSLASRKEHEECYTDFNPLATETGGKFYEITDPFDDILDDIAAQISSKYEIVYPATRPIYDGLTRNVEIEVQHGGETLLITGKQYNPGAAPKIALTQQTMDKLYMGTNTNNAYEENDDAPIQVYVYDYDGPRPHDGGTNQYVKLFYQNVSNLSDPFKELTLSCDKVFGQGDTAIWSTTIPGVDVLRPGVRFYLVASDGETSTPSPQITSMYTWTFAVQPNIAPVLTDSTAYRNPPAAPDTLIKSGYMVGDEITFRLHVFDETNYTAKVELHLDLPGSSNFLALPMDSIGGGIYTKTITLKEGDTRFYFLAEDDRGVNNSLGTEFKPYVIPTKVEECYDKHVLEFSSFFPRFKIAYTEFLGESLDPTDKIAFFFKDDKGNEIKHTEIGLGGIMGGVQLFCEDHNTPGRDGYTDGDDILIKIWKNTKGKYYNAYVSESKSKMDTNYVGFEFQDTKRTMVDSLIVYGQRSTVQKVGTSPEYWWSSYVDFQDYSFDAIFEEYTDKLSWVEDINGNRWTPGTSNNALTHYTAGVGYNVRLKSGVTDIEIETFGKQRDYSQETVTVGSAGTWVGCPYQQPESLLNIIANQDILMVMKKEGNSLLPYLPQFPSYSGWQSDLNVYPGHAYQFYSSATVTNVTFPAPQGAMKTARMNSGNYGSDVPQTVQDTKQFMTMVLPSSAFNKTVQNGDKVRIYNTSNECVGENIVNEAGSIVIIDGLNLATGEALEVRYVEANTNTETVLPISQWVTGDNIYKSQKIAIANDVTTATFPVHEDALSALTIYPNPTSEAIRFEVTMTQERRGEILVTDVKGATVYNDKSKLFTKGKQTVVLPIDLPKGIYTVSVINYDGNQLTQKVIVK